MGRFGLVRVFLSLGLVTLFLLSGCGRSSSGENSIRIAGPNPPGCGSPFQASLVVVSPQGIVPVGGTVAFRIAASFCSGFSFHIQGRPANERFLNNLDYSKTFPAAGTFDETVVVEAYESLNSSTPVATQLAKATLVVGQPGTTPPTGPGTFGCYMERVPGKAVTQADQPMAIVLRVVGTVTSAAINGVPVSPNVEFALPPSAPNSGIYGASAEVAGGNQRASCSFAAYTPACKHTVDSAFVRGFPESVKLETSTVLSGPVTAVFVNGETVVNLPVPPANVVSYVNDIPYTTRGPQRSVALVTSAAGDSSTCEMTYYANFSLAIHSLNPTYYIYATGFNESFYLNRSLTGLGAGAQGTKTFSYRAATYSVPILESGIAYPRVGLCGLNEVMVGRQPWPDPASALSLIQCARVRPELGIRNVIPRSMVWNYNAYQQCYPGTTLVGNFFTDGGAGLGTLTLMCGELYQLPN